MIQMSGRIFKCTKCSGHIVGRINFAEGTTRSEMDLEDI